MQTYVIARSRPNHREIMFLGIAVFVVIVALFRIMGVSVLQSDPFDYLLQSRQWWAMDDHMPGYAMLIWTVNLLTLGLLPPEILLQVSALIGWCVSVYYVDRILTALNPAYSKWGVALYALFPFVGVTYAAWPIGDSLAHATLVMGFWYLLRRDWPALTLSLSLMLLAHKGLWPFAFLIGVVAMWRHRYPLWQFVLSGIPLVAFWLAGVMSGGEWLWIIKIDLTRHLPSHSKLPVLDGVIGTLLSGGARGLVKGGTLLALLLCALWMTFVYAKRRSYEMLALLIPVLGLLFTMNQWEAWASIRFAKIIAVPLLGLWQPRPIHETEKSPPRLVFGSFVAALIVSQLAFAYYIDKYFEKDGFGAERLKAEQAAIQQRNRG